MAPAQEQTLYPCLYHFICSRAQFRGHNTYLLSTRFNSNLSAIFLTSISPTARFADIPCNHAIPLNKMARYEFLRQKKTRVLQQSLMLPITAALLPLNLIQMLWQGKNSQYLNVLPRLFRFAAIDQETGPGKLVGEKSRDFFQTAEIGRGDGLA